MPVVLTGLALACTWAVLPVAGAQAASTEKTCPETTLVQPFTAFGDSGYYSLVPGGSFEVGEPRWSTAGPAMVALGSEPYDVTGAPGWFSMALAPGGSAQSPFMCVEPNDRTFRFFLRADPVGDCLGEPGVPDRARTAGDRCVEVVRGRQQLGTLTDTAHGRRRRLIDPGRNGPARAGLRVDEGHRPRGRRLPRPEDAPMNTGRHPESRARQVTRHCQSRSLRAGADVRRSAWICILSVRGRAASRGGCGAGAQFSGEDPRPVAPRGPQAWGPAGLHGDDTGGAASRGARVAFG